MTETNKTTTPTKTRTAAAKAPQVPHVYTAMANILKSLSVPKNGTLPGNLGGKNYITAVDAAAETKRQFVENDLVFFPNEEVVSEEHIVHKDRLMIRVLIRGSYKIGSTLDGSSETVSGVGDGLATATAVASNVGSTNALKNALLRTFLITEQSVEDQAKEPREEKAAPQAVQRARQPQAPTPPANKGSSTDLKARIKSEFIDNDESPYDGPAVNALWADTQKKVGQPKGSDEVLTALLKRLEAGETA